MTLARICRFFCLAGLAVGLGGAYACSLNPQPLPPGETPDASTSTVFGPADGSALSSDGQAGGSSPDGGSDSEIPGPPEGGDGGDAGDGESDAPTDAPDSAPTDAQTDGEEGGG